MKLHLGYFMLYPFWYVRYSIRHRELDSKDKMLKEETIARGRNYNVSFNKVLFKIFKIEHAKDREI